MIHKIKALHDDGDGLSIRAIGKELGISRNTVRKYLRQDETAIAAAQVNRRRNRKLDEHRDYIVNLLDRHSELSSVKIARKLQARVGPLALSERTVRRYVRDLKQTVTCRQPRYYAPVVDSVPGVQCQVDPGEMRDVMIGGQPRTVHFVVFVLSWSRLMYVGVRFKPLDTDAFIALHDEAFRYFGGCPEECVYDQTKLVVLHERFRELELNQRFHQYATTAGYQIHVCRGYDPESKGKVEAGVKYVKQDALYGDVFHDEADLRAHVQHWLDHVANVRTHGTTGEQPRQRFEAGERQQLRPYQPTGCIGAEHSEQAQRRVDKTGLISWRANKYSVPMVYQRGVVGIREADDELYIVALDTGEVVATHALCHDKNRIIRNKSHYRDLARRVSELEQAINEQLGEALGTRLCQRLQATMPRYYRDQLTGALSALQAHPELDAALMAQWVQREGLTAGRLKQRLEAARMARARGRDASLTDSDTAPVDLTAYAQLGRPSGQQEVTHGAA